MTKNKSIIALTALIAIVGSVSMTYASQTSFFGEDCNVLTQTFNIRACNDLNDLNDRVIELESTAPQFGIVSVDFEDSTIISTEIVCANGDVYTANPTLTGQTYTFEEDLTTALFTNEGFRIYGTIGHDIHNFSYAWQSLNLDGDTFTLIATGKISPGFSVNLCPEANPNQAINVFGTCATPDEVGTLRFEGAAGWTVDLQGPNLSITCTE